MRRRSARFRYTLTPTEIKLAEQASQAIKEEADGKDRGSDQIGGIQASEYGMGAEIATPRILRPHYATQILKSWKTLWTAGRNVGQDFSGQDFGLDKDLECKNSDHKLSDHILEKLACEKCDQIRQDWANPILFTRTMAGDYRKGAPSPPLSYWKKVLPDSYYLLFSNYDHPGWSFEFIGWAVRETFFRHFADNEGIRQILSQKDYPPIGLYYRNYYDPWSLLDRIPQ